MASWDYEPVCVPVVRDAELGGEPEEGQAGDPAELPEIAAAEA